jgi:hypothetical protein
VLHVLKKLDFCFLFKHLAQYSAPDVGPMSTGRKIWKMCIKYVCLSRNAIAVLVSTIVIVLIMGDGPPPVVITGKAIKFITFYKL